MDIMTGLPQSNRYDALLVVVDRLSKMAHYLHTTCNVNSKGVAKLYVNSVFRLHSIPDLIACDRGTQFASVLPRALCKLASMQHKMSISYHAQTDGQTERVNSVVEQYLREYCNYQLDNLAELLTMSEFAYNNTISMSTGITPFYAMYGDHPRY